MRYLQDLGLSLDEPVVLAILTELAAPTMGELTRSGFVDGWKRLRYAPRPSTLQSIHHSTEPPPPPTFSPHLTKAPPHSAATLSDQKSTLPNLRTSLSSSSTSPQGLFRQTYKHTFRLALAPGQRSLPLDTALEYWRLLLSPPALKWNTKTTPWLDYWIEYLTTKGKKGVSKDMWEQTAVFAGKSLEDETMGWWSEDGAWPGCLDEFVGFVREKRGDGGAEEQGMEM